jgi:hypothetical protein
VPPIGEVLGRLRGLTAELTEVRLSAPGAVAALEVVPPENDNGHDFVYGVDVSPDGKRIALAS